MRPAGLVLALVALLAGSCRFSTEALPVAPGDGPGREGGTDAAAGDVATPADAARDRLAPADVAPPPDVAPQADVLPQRDAPVCADGRVYCAGVGCVDLQSDASHCGSCETVCAIGHCSVGHCCAVEETYCGGTCTDTRIDSKNCGECGTECSATTTCVEGICTPKIACAVGAEDQGFQQGMRGCKGTVTFASRATLCAAGFRVCTAAEWVARRGGVAPTYSYWTNDVLYASGQNQSCKVGTTPATWCDGTDPMRVCPGYSDPLGNRCNWINCGLNQTSPHDFFGGCQDNHTAGALCCP